MDDSARLFNCVRCKRQVIICRGCDRGNIYCGSRCSGSVRRAALQTAGQRYQKSLSGRQKHALRQRRYRERQKQKVTHQGSPVAPPDDLLASKPNEPAIPPVIKREHCHFCGKSCSSFKRMGFLHQKIRNEFNRPSLWLMRSWKNKRE